MYANRSGLQLGTLKKIGLAWVLTLPVAILLAGMMFIVGVFVVPGAGVTDQATEQNRAVMTISP